MSIPRVAAALVASAVAACSGESGETGERGPPPSPPATAAETGRDDAGVAAAEDALAAWEAWEEAVAAGSPGALEGRYAADAALVIGDAPAISGASRIGRYHELFAAGLADRERDIALAVARAGEVAVIAHVRGRHEGRVMGAPATGEMLGRIELSRFFVDGAGRITRHEIYTDALNVSAQLGRIDVDHRDPAGGANAEERFRRAAEGEAREARKATRELAEAHLGALGALDADRVAARFAERGVLHDASAASDVSGGRAIARHVRELGAAFPDLEFRDVKLWVQGSVAVATCRLAGTHDGYWQRLRARPSGARFDIPAAIAIAAGEGEIERAWWIYDGLAIADAIAAAAR